MKHNKVKLVIVGLLCAILFTYTNCGQPFSPPSELTFQSNIYGGAAQVSYDAFERTVYPITRANCVACHADISPTHAAADVKVAHDSIIKNSKVNFANIPASRMVAKLRDEMHNCWGNCADNASEMEAAIVEWNNAIKDSGTPTTADTAIYTSETDALEVEMADPTNPLKSNTVMLNVEAAMLRAPMERQKVGDTTFLTVPNNGMNATLVNNDANAGLAYMTFTVPATGAYSVWSNANGPADADNSFFVNILNNANASVSGGVRQFDIPVGPNFEWRRVGAFTANLMPNTTYRLEVRQREDGARASNFIVTSDTTFNGVEVKDYFGVTLIFDLSEQLKTPGVEFRIDVSEYDSYSYKFSKPRIVTTQAAPVYVKGVKVYVNGHFSPQNSTYTIVDKIVSSSDPSLSPYSMIVLKDQGMTIDRIKFSFDQLANATGSTTGATAGGAAGGTTGGGQTSLIAFQATVYPISRSSAYSCVGCHTAVSPRHASDNTLTAHDAVVGVTDFTNPANSQIVQKVRVGRHNCQNYCDEIANAYEAAIIEWRTRRGGQ